MLEEHKEFLIQNMKIPFIISIFLIGMSYYNYLLYHTFVELIAIGIGIILFATVLMFKIKYENSVLPFIAIGYFYISLIDLLHTLAYKGMNVLPMAGESANLATQLWIEGRFLQALILASALIFIDKQVSMKSLFFGLGAIFAAVTFIVLSGYAPDAYIDGYGLTLFKISMEYIIIGILIFALYQFYKNREQIGEKTTLLLIVSIIFTIFSELSFTFYISVFGISNLVGHIFKLFAFWFIFILIRDLVKINLQQSEK